MEIIISRLPIFDFQMDALPCLQPLVRRHFWLFKSS